MLKAKVESVSVSVIKLLYIRSHFSSWMRLNAKLKEKLSIVV